MNCPVCKTTMIKGQLASTGNLWIEKIVSIKLVKIMATLGKSNFVFAYRCPKCGKVELVSELDK